MHIIETFSTADATPQRLIEVRRVLDAAFGPTFSQADWDNAMGGCHIVATDAGRVVAHAAVVARPIAVADRRFHTGYVEAVATDPSRQGNGYGTAVMTTVAEVIQGRFELGALATGLYDFYGRLGWVQWRGSSFARIDDHLVRTEEDDDAIMVLPFGPSADVDLTAAISCDARTGDHW